jgi:hypothetical protein
LGFEPATRSFLARPTFLGKSGIEYRQVRFLPCRRRSPGARTTRGADMPDANAGKHVAQPIDDPLGRFEPFADNATVGALGTLRNCREPRLFTKILSAIPPASPTAASARAAAPGEFALRDAARSPPPAPAGCRTSGARRGGRSGRRCDGGRARRSVSTTFCRRRADLVLADALNHVV